MKATELRIGNLVLKNDILHEIAFYDFSSFFALDEYKAIPLTDEWLLKFGGILEEEDDSYIFGIFAVSVNNKSESAMFFKNHEIAEFKYIHQLQNLYFALTSEELTLNENSEA